MSTRLKMAIQGDWEQQTSRTEGAEASATADAHHETIGTMSARQEVDRLNALLGELLLQPRIGEATQTWEQIRALLGYPPLRRAA